MSVESKICHFELWYWMFDFKLTIWKELWIVQPFINLAAAAVVAKFVTFIKFNKKKLCKILSKKDFPLPPSPEIKINFCLSKFFLI